VQNHKANFTKILTDFVGLADQSGDNLLADITDARAAVTANLGQPLTVELGEEILASFVMAHATGTALSAAVKKAL